MSPLAFAWRSLTRERARAALGVAGVAIVGALLFDMLLLSRGLVLSFREVLLATGFDLRVTATRSLPGAGPPIADAGRTVAQLAALPEVAGVVPVRFARGWARAGDGSVVELGVVGTAARKSREWTILEGTDLPDDGPDASGLPPVVVNDWLARRLGLTVGSPIDLHPGTENDRSVLPRTAFRVAGIGRFPFEAAGQGAIKITVGAFRSAHFGADADEADLLLVASRGPGGAPAAAAALRRVRPDLDSFSVDEFLERFRQTDFSYFRQISFVLSTITAFFACLLVTTLLTVSVNQRLGEIAALRALGFGRLRVGLDLVAESGLLIGAGGVLAVPLGGLIAFVLDAILRGIPGLPASLHFFVPDPRAALALVAILGASALVAAVYPVWVVARLPVADTLRREVVS